MRVDSNQWPTYKIVNSCNNWLDTVTGYAIGADRRFAWDDTNHTDLPIGTIDITAGVRDYSFLNDEQGNRILNLLRIDMRKPNEFTYVQLTPIDQADIDGALDEYFREQGLPQYYDKIADNVIRLYPTPAEDAIDPGLRFYFQRTPSYFADTDTTKQPGVSPLLHRGFVIAAAYDGALALGLSNLQPLSVELQKEEQKMKQYFSIRNTDEVVVMLPPTVDSV